MKGTTEAMLIPVDGAAEMLGISVATLWRRSKDGTLPRPIRLGGSTRWDRAEILGAIEARKAARDAAISD